MSSANLELVRSVGDAWERGDYSAGTWHHPEMELVIADGPTPGRWTGTAAIAEGWGDFLRAWEQFHADVDEYRELDEERVLVLSRFGGRARRSGLEIADMTARSATVFHVCDGKVTKVVVHFDGARALAELGLAPETGSPGM